MSADAAEPGAPGARVAVVYCEGNFGRIDGKTANGLVRHSEAFRIASVIDSSCADQDSGQILDGVPNDIPVVQDLATALLGERRGPDTLIYGVAPSSDTLSAADRAVVLDAIRHGMNIVSGLHEYLGDDAELAMAARIGRVSIRDIRKPKQSKDMRLFDGSIAGVGALRIAILGTDCAIGKRTTATMLTRALNAAGIRTALVGTGQTGLMQGARFGIAMDAVPPQFCCGELEGAELAAFAAETPEVIVIEGRGALSHPAFCTLAFILRASQPQAVILQHAPARPDRCDFPGMPMPDPDQMFHHHRLVPRRRPEDGRGEARRLRECLEEVASQHLGRLYGADGLEAVIGSAQKNSAQPQKIPGYLETDDLARPIRLDLVGTDPAV